MKIRSLLLCTIMLLFTARLSIAQSSATNYSIPFCSGTFNFKADKTISINVQQTPKDNAAQSFYASLNSGNYKPVIDSLLLYKSKYQLNDWVYYQLIRRTAQQLSPKKDNYFRYTLYKWFFLTKSGYDARLAVANDKIIFYVYNNEDIEDIPFFMVEGNKYICLNYHDYGSIDFAIEKAYPVSIKVPEAKKQFSYKITRMPDFKRENYEEKDLEFNYKHKDYHFKIKLNPEVESIFKNYPIVDFESYFNIPLSNETYSSLIPLLKKNIGKMSRKKGVNYLMQFTRYAFLYRDDEKNFGKEKRLSPELTLFSEYSDCDDRAALFFFLVKEIYNLPMVALLYPTHITMAVQFDKPMGKPIEYKGKKYTLCEPTLQPGNLAMGQVSSKLKNIPFQVVYEYNPQN